MTTTDDRKKNFESPVARLVLLVSLLFVISLVWFNFGNQPIPDQSPAKRVSSQSTRTGLHSEPEKTPQQVFIPAKTIARPVPAINRKAVAIKDTEESNKEKPFVMPEWEKIFSSDGSLKDEIDTSGRLVSNGIPDYIDLYDGVMSRFVSEVISNGVYTDMSALLGADSLDDQVLYNGPVTPAHDLGNVYFMTSNDASGGPRFFTAVGRLSSQVKTYIDFEFNQYPIYVGSGAPWWNLKSERRDGDLLVRMNFSADSLVSVKVLKWQEGSFESIRTLPGLYTDGCHRQTSMIYCIAPSRISEATGEGFEVWDEDFVISEPTPPDEIVELAIDVRKLLSINVEFNSIVIRTPQDIAINTFRRVDLESSLAVLTSFEELVQ